MITVARPVSGRRSGVVRDAVPTPICRVCSCILLLASVSPGWSDAYLVNKESFVAYACASDRVDELKSAGGRERTAGTYRDVEYSEIVFAGRRAVFAPGESGKQVLALSSFSTPNPVPVFGHIGAFSVESVTQRFGEPASIEGNRREFVGETSSIDVFDSNGTVTRIQVTCGSFVF